MTKIFDVDSCARCPHRTWKIQDPNERIRCLKSDGRVIKIDIEWETPDWCPLPDNNVLKLLEVLEDLVHDIDVYEFLEDFEDDDSFEMTVDAARSTIAKARGEK